MINWKNIHIFSIHVNFVCYFSYKFLSVAGKKVSRLAGGLIGTKLDKAKFVGSVISHKPSHDAKKFEKLSYYLPNNLAFTSFKNA